MSEKKQLNLRVNQKAYEAFEKVAEADHMSAIDLAALLIAKFGDLKHGTALDAIASINKDLFKGRPGRPPSGPVGSDTHEPSRAA